jgi:hypothetical protein
LREIVAGIVIRMRKTGGLSVSRIILKKIVVDANESLENPLFKKLYLYAILWGKLAFASLRGPPDPE